MEIDTISEKNRHAVLMVDKDGENLDAFRMGLRARYNLLTAADFDEALRILKSKPVAVLIVDYEIANSNGLDLIRSAVRMRPRVKGILMTAQRSPEIFQDAIDSGFVWKILLKPWETEDLDVMIADALKSHDEASRKNREHASLAQLADYYVREISAYCDFDIVIGERGGLSGVFEKILGIAPSRMPVLLRGERGVGKQTLARKIHQLSDRSGAPFVRIDAAVYTDRDLEEEIFGDEYEDSESRKGRAELADSGTLFVENIDALPLEAQFRLSELITTGVFEPVKGVRRINADVRIIASSAADLESMVAARAFHKDLMDVLGEYSIGVPPLRERPGDLPALSKLLANRFTARTGRGSVQLDETAIDAVKKHFWPGNMPELANVIELAVLHCRGGIIGGGDIRPLIGASSSFEPQPPEKTDGGLDENLTKKLAEIERDEISDALKKARGNKAVAARLLGINRSTLYYRMKKFGLFD